MFTQQMDLKKVLKNQISSNTLGYQDGMMILNGIDNGSFGTFKLWKL